MGSIRQLTDLIKGTASTQGGFFDLIQNIGNTRGSWPCIAYIFTLRRGCFIRNVIILLLWYIGCTEGRRFFCSAKPWGDSKLFLVDFLKK